MQFLSNIGAQTGLCEQRRYLIGKTCHQMPQIRPSHPRQLLNFFNGSSLISQDDSVNFSTFSSVWAAEGRGLSSVDTSTLLKRNNHLNTWVFPLASSLQAVLTFQEFLCQFFRARSKILRPRCSRESEIVRITNTQNICHKKIYTNRIFFSDYVWPTEWYGWFSILLYWQNATLQKFRPP